MKSVRPMRSALLLVVLACAAVGLMADEATAQTDSSSGESSFGQSIVHSFQNLGKSPTPPSTPDDDPVSLKTKPKVGVELYVAVARLYTENGKFAEAEEQYQQALKMAPNDLRALLGYAMLKDQMNQPQEALKFYQQAEKKYPKQPAVYNNLAIHYARRDMVGEAIEAGRRAVDLRPREPRYRNNLAAMLVEAGMPQDAFKQLREVYDEPVAHYNLGFLLNKRGMKAAALQEFTIALQLSPRMALARQWVERLSQERGASSPAVVGMRPVLEQAPAGVAPQGAYQRPEVSPAAVAPSPPQYGSSPQYSSPAPRPAQAQYPVPSPPQAQAQIPVPSSEPARLQYPAQASEPARWQYPAQVQYPAVPPQNAGPQYPLAPQSQNPVPASPPAASPMPVVASRDTQATGVRVISPPATDNSALRRLPPVSDPRNPADASFQGQGSDVVAPNPPNWQR